jgi:peptide/nickel transport system ATP-binding protein
MAPLVSMRDLKVDFDGVPALRGLSLDIHPGEALGMVGESGCGKSVTWLAALGLLPGKARISGSVRLGGTRTGRCPRRDAGRRARAEGGDDLPGPGFSALNPVHRVGKQVEEALRLHRGLRGAAARTEARRLFDQVGIPDAARRLDAWPHELSGGQNQRVMIAMALAGRPELLVADEPTTALDVTIQAQILESARRIRREQNMALVLISHDLGVVSRDLRPRAGDVCRPGGGAVRPRARLFDAPPIPIRLRPAGGAAAAGRAARAAGGHSRQVPDPARMPPGCAFAPRCPQAARIAMPSVPARACAGARPGRGLPAPGQRARQREYAL